MELSKTIPKPVEQTNASRGFTMVELIVVLVIVGIMSAGAVVMFRTTMPNRNLANEMRTIYSGIQHAKVEAVKRKTCAVIKYSPPGAAFPKSHRAFLDNGANPGETCSQVHNAGEEYIYPEYTLADNIQLMVCPNSLLFDNVTPPTCSAAGFDSICFSAMGTVCGGQPVDVLLWTVDSSGNIGKRMKVSVSAGGGVRLESSNDSGATWSN